MDERQRIRAITEAFKEYHQQRYDKTASLGERVAQRFAVEVLEKLLEHIDSGITVDELIAAMYS